MKMSKERISVIHSHPIWLPQTATWMCTQIKYLPPTIDAHVVCEDTANLDQFNVPNIHCLSELSPVRSRVERYLRKYRLRPRWSYLRSVAKNVNAKIIHSHFGDIGWTNLAAIRGTSLKHVVTFYGYDVSYLPSTDRRWLFRYKELFLESDVFLCEGAHMASRLVALGCPPSKVRVHHLGINTETIRYCPRRWKQGERFRVLIAGSFREKKGIPDALEALGKIRDVVPLDITIIGDAGPEPRSQREKERVLNTINKTGLRLSTRLLGYQPHQTLISEAYRHHLFISPSVTASDGDSEGGAPVSLIEMMATGIPVVTTVHCDIPDVVRYGIDGWLVEEHDITGLTERIEWLLENEGNWGKFLEAGRAHVELEFNAAHQGRRLEKIYLELLGV